MRDKISEDRAKQLDPALIDEVIVTITTLEVSWPKNVCVRLTETYRPPEKQDAYYEIGRTRPGKIITNATAMKSVHQYRRAFDMCILIDGKPSWALDKYFKAVVAAFKAKGWEWAGDWKTFREVPHLQKTMGLSVKRLYDLWKQGQVVNGYVKR
jgi:peptidoglycan L-alanyl-D-glutamate endopeptidase CwlK